MNVLKVPSEKLERLRLALENRAATPMETTNPHEAFRLELGRFPLVAYTSGKLTVGDARILPILEEVLEEVLDPVDHPLVGSDEAGKGEWLGPLAVGAAAVLPEDRAWLVAHGAMDSKEVAKGALAGVARAIDQRLAHTSVLLVSPPRFTALHRELKAEGKGLNDLLAWAHAKALGDVLASLAEAGHDDGARVLVDEFDRVRTEARAALAFDVDRYPVEQRPRAEDEVAVACASVLAKAARERWIDAYERKSGSPVRSLARDRAATHPKVAEFAKVDYLR